MNWKPENYPSVSSYLICSNGEALVTFIEEAFDGVLLRRFDRPDGSLMHAEIRIDDSVIMVGGGATSVQSCMPHIHLYVPDALTVFARAIAAGATVIQEPCRKRDDDDLRGGIQDPLGTTWWVASQLP